MNSYLPLIIVHSWTSQASLWAERTIRCSYIQIEQTGEARALNFVVDGEETTAIEDIEVKSSENGIVYNLNGQRVSVGSVHAGHKGIYIRDGKKVVR